MPYSRHGGGSNCDCYSRTNSDADPQAAADVHACSRCHADRHARAADADTHTRAAHRYANADRDKHADRYWYAAHEHADGNRYAADQHADANSYADGYGNAGCLSCSLS
jgi:hypothetical protein